jgi:hypothetical protein
MIAVRPAIVVAGKRFSGGLAMTIQICPVSLLPALSIAIAVAEPPNPNQEQANDG